MIFKLETDRHRTRPIVSLVKGTRSKLEWASLILIKLHISEMEDIAYITKRLDAIYMYGYIARLSPETPAHQAVLAHVNLTLVSRKCFLETSSCSCA